jgi:hypothetical protein
LREARDLRALCVPDIAAAAATIAWSKSNRKPIEFSILTLSAVLFLSAAVRGLKLILLGNDYSDRLFATIGINLLMALALGIYLGVKRRPFAALP